MEWRRHPRVKEDISVRWSMPAEGVEGQGIVRNVSVSGLLLEVDADFKPVYNAKFTIEMLDKTIPAFIPHHAQLVWFNHVIADKARKFCGLKFLDPTGAVFTRLQEHVDNKIETMLQAADINIMNRYLYQSN